MVLYIYVQSQGKLVNIFMKQISASFVSILVNICWLKNIIQAEAGGEDHLSNYSQYSMLNAYKICL